MTSRRQLLGAAVGTCVAGAIGAKADPSCVFCRIVAGTAETVTVHRDAHTIAFGALHPREPGHVLVAPIDHVENLYGVHEPLAGRLLASAARIARAMKRVLHTDGVTLVQNSEPAGDQTVFHLHIHVIPRYTGRPLWQPHAEPVEASLGARERVLAPLRDALRRPSSQR